MTDKLNKVSELLYASFDRALHPEFLGAANSCLVEGERVSTSLYLGRAGHLVVFRSADAALTEMLVPRDRALPRSGLIKSCSFGDLMHFSFKHNGPLFYRVSVTIERLDPASFGRRAEELVLAARNIRASFCRNPADELSFSVASLDEGKDHVTVSVIHFCKGDNSIVRSVSTARAAE
ncbi:MAG: hypothetical protein DRP90_03195 [Planctomycetota bacterium]|nr:MAG: hypothetical protein DRP90_03195 [Planctomycetota bacterium]